MTKIYLSSRQNTVAVVDNRRIDLYRDWGNGRIRLLLEDDFEDGLSSCLIVKIWQSREAGDVPYGEEARAVLFNGPREEAEKLFEELRKQAAALSHGSGVCALSPEAWTLRESPQVDSHREKKCSSSLCALARPGLAAVVVLSVLALSVTALNRYVHDEMKPVVERQDTTTLETPSSFQTSDIEGLQKLLRDLLTTDLAPEIGNASSLGPAAPEGSPEPTVPASGQEVGALPPGGAPGSTVVQAQPPVSLPAPHAQPHAGPTMFWPGQFQPQKPPAHEVSPQSRGSVILDIDNLPPLTDPNTPVGSAPSHQAKIKAPQPGYGPKPGERGGDAHMALSGVAPGFPGAPDGDYRAMPGQEVVAEPVMPEEGPRGEPDAAAEVTAVSSAPVADEARGESATDGPGQLSSASKDEVADDEVDVLITPPEDVGTKPGEGDTGAEEQLEEDGETADAEASLDESLNDEGPMEERMLEALQKVSDPQAVLAHLTRLNTRIRQGEKLAPSMLEGLPEAIVREFHASGVVDENQEVEELVYLPGKVIPKNRYGIPTIPQENMWVYYDGNVVIPLPGGGTIEDPDDMKDFGLDP